MNRKKIISTQGISIGYSKTKHRDKTCLYNNLSFDLYSGELVCILGANGAGKSTLLRTISNLQPPLAGTISLYDKDITTYSKKDLSKILGLVLTDKTSIGGLKVRELVELGRYPYTGFFGQLDPEDKEIVEKAMQDVCIIHKAESYVAELSDGERQKAMIAKSLAQECPIILLDEPTAFLDIESRIEIVNLLHYLAENNGKTILMSTHDMDLALLLADRLWLLSRDSGLICGATEDIVLSGKMESFFKNKNIIFDKDLGNFLPNRKSDKKVILDAVGYHRYWANNLIERHGYEATLKESDALFKLTITSSESISLEMNGINKEFSDFEQLATWITNYTKHQIQS